jgi:uncharacterized protein YifN (PemK superfamily)
MALPYLPRRGEILVCDFDETARGAEMVKRRPVLVISRHETHRRKLCTVLPLSTTEPNPVEKWNHPCPDLCITGWQATGRIWIKADMLATVSLERLTKPYKKTRQGRQYIEHMLPQSDIDAALECLRHYLHL